MTEYIDRVLESENLTHLKEAIITLSWHCICICLSPTHASRPRHWLSDPAYTALQHLIPLTDIVSPAATAPPKQASGKRDRQPVNVTFQF